MTPENRDILLQLLDRHRALGISEQLGYEKSYMDSLIASSASLVDLTPEPTVPEMVDKQTLQQIMVDKWSIKPTLADKLVDILAYVADKEDFTTESIVRQFGFTPTTAKRYLRQLTEFGYLESHGGNRNRTHQFMQTGNS